MLCQAFSIQTKVNVTSKLHPFHVQCNIFTPHSFVPEYQVTGVLLLIFCNFFIVEWIPFISTNFIAPHPSSTVMDSHMSRFLFASSDILKVSFVGFLVLTCWQNAHSLFGHTYDPEQVPTFLIPLNPCLLEESILKWSRTDVSCARCLCCFWPEKNVYTVYNGSNHLCPSLVMSPKDFNEWKLDNLVTFKSSCIAYH